MIEFEAQGFKDIKKRLDRGETVVRISLNEGLREIGSLVTPILKRHTPIGATRNLRNKTRFQVIGGPGYQELQIRQGAKGSSGFFYGLVVREGRRPGIMPPVSALVPWVMAVLGVSQESARSVAFLVARKIGKRGTKPNPYHRKALRMARGGIQAIVNRMGAKVVAHITGGK